MSDSYRFERRIAILSVAVSAVLLAIKFAAYYVTGSAAIFSDALESIVNVVASSIMLYSIILSHAPADEAHPYGHGKVEFLSAALEGGMILLAALVIVARAIEQFVRGAEVQQLRFGIVLTVLAMAVNGVVGTLLVRAGRRHGSIALEADGRHLLSDALTTVAALAALLLVAMTGWNGFDAIGALLIGVYIGSMGVRLFRRATGGLMDEQDLEDDRLIRSILDAHAGPQAVTQPRICSYHKLRHRHTGRYHWIDFHIVVPRSWNVERAHEVASALEYEIEQSLGQADATAHIEPCEGPGCEDCAPQGRQ